MEVWRHGGMETGVLDYDIAYFHIHQHCELHKGSSYSGTPLIQTPMGQKKVSVLVRCPHFRG